MNIERIELEWFRGAAEQVTLETDGKNVVIYGANGSGKSSFVDAIELLARGGRIGHLSHEYSGTSQVNAVRNSHTPPEVPAVARLVTNSFEVEAAVSPAGDLDIDDGNGEATERLDASRFLLRQDELANFIVKTKGKKYEALVPLLGLDHYECCAENLRQLGKAIGTEGQLNTRAADLRSLEEDISEVLGEYSESVVAEAVEALESHYGSSKGTLEERAVSVREQVDGSTGMLEEEIEHFEALRVLRDLKSASRIEELIKREEEASDQIDDLLAKKVAVLEATQTFESVAKEDPLDCPACGRSITATTLESHVARELEGLRDARDTREALQRERRDVRGVLREARVKLSEEALSIWLEERGAEIDLSHLGGLLDNAINHDARSPWDEPLQENLLDALGKLEEDLARLLEETPPSIKAHVKHRKEAEACEEFFRYQRLKRRQRAVEALVEATQDLESEVRDALHDTTANVLAELSSAIQSTWASLHPEEPIEDVRLYIPSDADKAIDVALQFFGKEQPSPRLTLSEGHRNSLGLCIFLALARQGPQHPIILDDIVSSLDREHRGRVTTLLRDEFEDRQILLFTHDREWYAELRRMFPRRTWSFRRLKPWREPTVGIQWTGTRDRFDEARELLDTNPEAAGNRARATMDSNLAIVAERLRLPLPYARGDRNDHRTSVDFLRALLSHREKFIKKISGDWSQFEYAEKLLRKAYDHLTARANRASHTGSMTRTEVEDLIEACEATLDVFHCEDCGDPVWIADQNRRKRFQCACDSLRWKWG